MLAAFRFKNSRSFRGEMELSFIASGADKTHPSALIDPAPSSRSSVSLLPVLAIYGANAAGKTNVLESLSLFANAIASSQSRWQATGGVYVFPHSLGEIGESSFEVECFFDEVRYRYGFSASTDRFTAEWLYSYPKGKQRLVFDREVGKDGVDQIKTGASFGGTSTYVEGVKARVRHNSLFVSAAAQDNHSLSITIQEFFNGIFERTLLESNESGETFTSLFCESSETFKRSVLTVLKLADPSIKDLIIKKREGHDWNDVKARHGENFFDKKRFTVSFLMGSGDEEFELPASLQSVGVKKLYAMIGEILISLGSSSLMIVDELEASMHPHIARAIVDLFQNPEINKGRSQLVFSTHDTNLLDQNLLRRDQIWFVEKVGLDSNLYSLSDFSPRTDANLEQGYLRGKYGAIPVVSMPPGWLEPGSYSGEGAEDVLK